METALSGLEKKLSNEKFLSNAPDEIVAKEKQRQLEYRGNLDRLQQNLEALS